MRRNYIFLLIFFFTILLPYDSLAAEAGKTQADEDQLAALALKQPVSVHAYPDRKSSVLKNYPYGKKLQFRLYSDGWYEATVYVKGQTQIGYIHSSDVGNGENERSVKGIALKTRTHVYSDTNRKKSLKSYPQGHILTYRAYDNNWFEATVIINGKRQTGYISTEDVETVGPAPKE